MVDQLYNVLYLEKRGYQATDNVSHSTPLTMWLKEP